MIQGYNIKLNSPTIQYNSQELLNNEEIASLIKAIQEYFYQTNIIYNADLTLTNNEWENHRSKNGQLYKKRKDYTFRLMDLNKVILNDDNIEFHIFDNNNINTLKIKICKNFFWFFDWESSYYD